MKFLSFFPFLLWVKSMKWLIPQVVQWLEKNKKEKKIRSPHPTALKRPSDRRRPWGHRTRVKNSKEEVSGSHFWVLRILKPYPWCMTAPLGWSLWAQQKSKQGDLKGHCFTFSPWSFIQHAAQPENPKSHWESSSASCCSAIHNGHQNADECSHAHSVRHSLQVSRKSLLELYSHMRRLNSIFKKVWEVFSQRFTFTTNITSLPEELKPSGILWNFQSHMTRLEIS